MDSPKSFRVTYDKQVDAAYIYLREIEGGGVAISHPVEGYESAGEIILDFDREKRLVGIEVLGAKRALPPEVIEPAAQLPPGSASQSRGGESNP